MKRVKIAIVGCKRGGYFIDIFNMFNEQCKVTAVCDIDQKLVTEITDENPEIEGYTDYDKMLQKGDFDAVFIATPIFIHAEQSIKALKADKHVLSEVIAGTTVEELKKLVGTVEDTGMKYMYAENYCYMQPNMMILNMVEQDLFGDLTYAEGGYIHDCRDIFFNDDGSLTWRGKLSRDYKGSVYPTHSIGPVAQWLGINKTDRLKELTCFTTPGKSPANYSRENFGKNHFTSGKTYFEDGCDSSTTVIKTEKGAVIVIRVDLQSIRPHNMRHYMLQGTKASYHSARGADDDHLIWIKGESETREDGLALSWDKLEDYKDKYNHPYWENEGDMAKEAGHGGGDYFIIKDFLDSIINDINPAIDVYDAAVWSSLFPLSMESVKQESKTVEIPDFK